ncbi:hypothetical protein [Trueperella pyogenes]
MRLVNRLTKVVVVVPDDFAGRLGPEWASETELESLEKVRTRKTAAK